MPARNIHARPEAVRTVVADERPYSARSVLASTLMGIDPPQLPSRLLVRVGELFGIAEGTTRVAVSRMLAAGELEADDGTYRLAGRLASRQARQRQSRRGATGGWNRSWTMAVVEPGARPAADRSELRAAMRALHLAELREAVWLRPDNLPADAATDDAAKVVADQCRRFRVEPDGGPEASIALVRQLWDLDGWAERARVLLAAIAQLVGDLARERAESLPDGFVVSAAVLRHLNADPLLPSELLPDDWPGAALRADYERYDTAFKAAWRDWFAAQR